MKVVIIHTFNIEFLTIQDNILRWRDLGIRLSQILSVVYHEQDPYYLKIKYKNYQDKEKMLYFLISPDVLYNQLLQH